MIQDNNENQQDNTWLDFEIIAKQIVNTVQFLINSIGRIFYKYFATCFTDDLYPIISDFGDILNIDLVALFVDLLNTNN